MSGAAYLAAIPYGLGTASILIGKHIDQRAFDTSQAQRTLPVLLGEQGARALNRLVVVGMYVFTLVAILFGALSPLAVLVAARRATRDPCCPGHVDPAAAGRTTGRLPRMAPLVPPGVPGAQPVVRLGVHRSVSPLGAFVPGCANRIGRHWPSDARRSRSPSNELNELHERRAAMRRGRRPGLHHAATSPG